MDFPGIALPSFYVPEEQFALFNAYAPARLLYTFTLDYATTEPSHVTLTETAAIMALDRARWCCAVPTSAYRTEDLPGATQGWKSAAESSMTAFALRT
jgi:hypothetical protein